MKTTRLTLAALTVTAVLGASACSSDDGPSAGDETVSVSATTSTSDGDASTSSSEAQEPPESPEDAEDLEPLMTAIDTAEESLGGTAYEADDQDRDGTWEINVAVKDKGVEVKVGADGSEVVSKDDEDELDDDERAGLKAAEVAIGEAIETAMKETDGTFDDAELEEEDGTHVWEVSIDTDEDDVDVLIDVTSGTVIATNTD